MFVVLKLDCYAGDGCEDQGQYTVSEIFGLFKTGIEAQEWADAQPRTEYAIEYEVRRVSDRIV